MQLPPVMLLGTKDMLPPALQQLCHALTAAPLTPYYTFSQVHTGTRLTHGVLGVCAVVVSAKFPPDHVDQRVEAFLGSFEERWAGLALALTPPCMLSHAERNSCCDDARLGLSSWVWVPMRNSPMFF
jgi:hypothetical protein